MKIESIGVCIWKREGEIFWEVFLRLLVVHEFKSPPILVWLIYLPLLSFFLTFVVGLNSEFHSLNLDFLFLSSFFFFFFFFLIFNIESLGKNLHITSGSHKESRPHTWDLPWGAHPICESFAPTLCMLCWW